MVKQFVETNKETRRARIINAAIDIISEGGYSEFKLDKVVTRAGTSKSAIYALFKNKEGLLKAVCENEVFKVGNDMISKISEDMTAEVVLSNILESYIRRSTSKNYNAAISMIISEMKHSEAIGRYYFEIGPLRVLAKIEKFLEKKVEQGELAIDDCGLAAKHLIGTVTWYRSALLMYTREVDTDIDKLLAQGKVSLQAFLKAYAVNK